MSQNLQERVELAAQAVLDREGSVGLLELFQQMGFLHLSHLDAWRKGRETHQTLEPWLQVGAGKRERTIQLFQQWARSRGLQTVEAAHTRQGLAGVQALRVSADGNPEVENLFRVRYLPSGLTPQQTARLTASLNRPAELVVYQKVGAAGQCAECNAELTDGDFLVIEANRPLCLECADLDHLVFLPAGNMALTRRARRHSSLSAVVVRFIRSRKRYERQGLLVGESALARAEEECAADAHVRAAARARVEISRQREDQQFVAALSQAILDRYPKCPAAEARHIAEHTGMRNSGRVGRSAAGRTLDAAALDLAVIAHIRHEHTKYDELLMQGTDRQTARQWVRDQIEKVVAAWS